MNEVLAVVCFWLVIAIVSAPFLILLLCGKVDDQ